MSIYNIKYKTDERTVLVLQVLREQGFTYHVISGISVGFLNGAMLATDNE